MVPSKFVGDGVASVQLANFGYTQAELRVGGFFAPAHGHNALPAAVSADLNIRAGVIASINSYLGFLRHYSTVRLRRSLLARVAPGWWAYLRAEGKAHKVVECARSARST